MKAQLHCIASELVASVRRGYRGRSQQEILDHYNRPGSGDPKPVDVKTNPVINSGMVAVRDIINQLGVKNVCEVGCGSGRNLDYLKWHLSNIDFCGYDISPWRVDNACRKGVDARVGSAFDLPVKAQSFDLVFTFAALEQMNANIDEALFNIRKASSKYVLFYEPFADTNNILERIYLWTRNYFRMHSRELSDHSLRVISVDTNFPRKPTFGYAMVLCKVT